MSPLETDVLVVGDGPTGLSAALLLAKNGMSVDVLGADETPMYRAWLYNYLAIEDIQGPEFMRRAREQAERHGARIRSGEAQRIETREGEFLVHTATGEQFHTRYLVLATGRDQRLADALDLTQEDGLVAVDLRGRTSYGNVYAGGWLTRGHQIQAAISVGDGAAIALDIISQERGKPFHDFDVLPKGSETPPADQKR